MHFKRLVVYSTISIIFTLHGFTQSVRDIFDENLIPVNNISVSKSEQGRSDVHVFIFYSADCPICIKQTKTLNEIRSSFLNQSISYYVIFPGDNFSGNDIRKFQKKYHFKFPAYIDRKYVVSKFFNARVTPEVFVTGSDYRILYSGKIDNWYEKLGVRRKLITEHFLKDAIASALEGRQPGISRTEPVGCFINY